MASPAYITQAEQQIYREYELRRRLRLAQIIAPGFFVALLAIIVSNLVYSLVHPSINRSPFPGIAGVLAQAVIPISLLFYGLGTYFAWRRRVNLAVACTLLGTIGPVVIGFAVYAAAQGLDVFLAVGLLSTVNLIILIGVMTANPWILIVATLGGNGYALAVLNLATPPPALAYIATERPLFIPMVLAIQWVCTTLLLATGRTYLRTLRELGETRVAYERARKLDELKDQFITNVNHELRTPAMAMQGYLELLQLTEAELSPEERKAFLDRATRASNGMVDLLTSILEARKLDGERPSFTPAPVQLAPLCADIIALLGTQLAGHQPEEIQLAVPANLAVLAEVTPLRQILVNLITNACKYSPPGTPVMVTARAVEVPAQAGGRKLRPMVEIAVRDYGLGIPPDEAPLLFHRFVRLQRDLASTIPGNGLGLYISRRLCEEMHGTLDCASTGIPGEGTTFTVRLPVA